MSPHNHETFRAGDPVVALAADEGFARPLAVTLCSALANLAPERCLSVFVLDGGFRQAAPYLAAIHPVPNYRELGIPGSARYFNAGVMVIDLDHWRRAQVTEQLLTCLEQNRKHVLWWDQDALNAVLWHAQRRLDPRWNQGAHIHEFPSWRESSLDQDTHRTLLAAPYIVHFSSPSTPWLYASTHPWRELFFHYLDRTAWAGWRPQKPPFSLRRWCQQQYRGWAVVVERTRRRIAVRLGRGSRRSTTTPP